MNKLEGKNIMDSIKLKMPSRDSKYNMSHLNDPNSDYYFFKVMACCHNSITIKKNLISM